MKKHLFLFLILSTIISFTACANQGDSLKEEVSVDTVIPSDATIQEDVEEISEEVAFDKLLPKDQRTVLALQSLETTLPAETVGENFPEDVEVLARCSGDIGNDGVNDVAVILENQYYGYGDELYVLCMFEEAESGTYRYTEYTEELFLRDKEDDWATEYFYDVRIKDGRLHVTNAMQTEEYINYESIWVLEDEDLILNEVVESHLNTTSGNGLEIQYKMQEGTAVCSAASLWNQAMDGRIIYNAVFTPEKISAETIDEKYIPEMSEMYCTYAEDGRNYDYRRLGFTNEMYADFLPEDSWKAAYVKWIDALLKTDENAGQYDFALLYIDEDDIPELVYGPSGYWVSVCTYAPGQESLGVADVVAVMERGAYGAFGNYGYEYLPGENVMRNYDNDYAGAVRYTSYFKVGSNKEIADIYYLKTEIYDENGTINANTTNATCKYFYNGELQITEEEYNNYIIKGDFQYIEGNQEGYKIIAELCKGNSYVEQAWKDAYKEVIETVTKEHGQSEAATLELTYDLIYLNDDYIPELVIGQPKVESWVSVYSYTLGKYSEGVENVAVLADRWRYNYGCNYGFHYETGTGWIEEYVELHGNGYYFQDYYMNAYGELSEGPRLLCEIEWLSEAEGRVDTYYRDDEELTQERWDYLMEERQGKVRELLEGTKTYDEIMTELEIF